jgi:uncharacterized membrane protein
MIKALAIFLYCFLYALLNIAGVTTIKLQINNRKLSSLDDYIQLLKKPLVILSFGVIFLSALVMFKALSVGKFSIIGPLATGINFTLTIIMGMVFFKEQITLPVYIGLALILIGIIIISLKS